MRKRQLTVLVFLVLSLAGSLWAQDEKSTDGTTVAQYSIQSGRLSPTPEAEHRTIWEGIQSWVPPSLLGMIVSMELFAAADEGETFTDAWALQGDGGKTFTLGLNLASARAAFVDRDPDSVDAFRYTVIHELGHVLSFQASQLDETGTVKGTLVLDEGTLKPKAYLNLFFEQFWKKAYPGRGTETSSDEDGAALYKKSPASFVSEYAATGPAEDFAESFATYTTTPPERGNTVRQQKLKFFAGFPELVRLRDEIQVRMTSR